jgi:RND family efflux transporter MFP subunit
MFSAKLKNLKDLAEIKLTLSDGSIFTEKGEIEYFENIAEERTDTIRVYVKFPNKSRTLKIGTSVRVTLSSKVGVTYPAIRPTALLQDIQGPYVWALDENSRAIRRTIARGDLLGDWLVVEKGLKEGETIVIEGAHKVRKGMKIKAPEAK